MPEVWQNVDLLKLKCSNTQCDQIFTVGKLMEILEPSKFAAVSAALNKRVMQSSEDFIACPNQECPGFGFFSNEDGDAYHEVVCG